MAPLPLLLLLALALPAVPPAAAAAARVLRCGRCGQRLGVADDLLRDAPPALFSSAHVCTNLMNMLF